MVNCGTCKLAYMRSGIGGEAFSDADGVAMEVEADGCLFEGSQCRVRVQNLL